MLVISILPLALASLGGLLSHKAGVLNISLEGCMGLGAFLGAIMVYMGFPVSLALLAAFAGGCLSGLLVAVIHHDLGANLFIAALGLNLLLPSITSLISNVILGHSGSIAASSSTNLFDTPWWSLAGILIFTGLVWYSLTRSSFGLSLSVAGSTPQLLTERGISLRRIRLTVLALSSGMAALAGALISLRIGAYVPGISAGRGWIALVMIWLGFQRTLGVVLASCLFVLVEHLAGGLQGTDRVPATLLLAFPYLIALIFLILPGIGKITDQSTSGSR